jgi:hypothetical protein
MNRSELFGRFQAVGAYRIRGAFLKLLNTRYPMRYKENAIALKEVLNHRALARERAG